MMEHFCMPELNRGKIDEEIVHPCPRIKNIALSSNGGVASQSTTWYDYEDDDDESDETYAASKANDGSTNGAIGDFRIRNLVQMNGGRLHWTTHILYHK